MMTRQVRLSTYAILCVLLHFYALLSAMLILWMKKSQTKPNKLITLQAFSKFHKGISSDSCFMWVFRIARQGVHLPRGISPHSCMSWCTARYVAAFTLNSHKLTMVRSLYSLAPVIGLFQKNNNNNLHLHHMFVKMGQSAKSI